MPIRKKTAKSPGSVTQIFRNIAQLFTLEGAALKHGRRILPADLSRIERGAIVAREGRILWVGQEKKIPKALLRGPSAKIESEDMRGAVVVPAFVEPHTHLIYAGHRAGEFERRNQGESYQSIAKSGGGILATVRATRDAPERELADIGQRRAERFLKQGVTTIEAKSGYALTLEGEMKMLRAAGRIKRARIVRTFLGAHAIPEGSTAEAYIDELVKVSLPRVKQECLAERVDIFVEKGYFTGELARKYLTAARDLGFDLAVHAEQLSHSGGAQLAVELGARSAEHLIQIDEKDILRLAKSEVTSVLLPSADLYMNCAYPPARKLIDKGARVALATDLNPGTSPSSDLALVGVLSRIQMKMSLAEVIGAYTIGGAYALGLEKDLGSLSAGKFCDFSVLENGIDELFLEVGHQPIARVYREAKRLI